MGAWHRKIPKVVSNRDWFGSWLGSHNERQRSVRHHKLKIGLGRQFVSREWCSCVEDWRRLEVNSHQQDCKSKRSLAASHEPVPTRSVLYIRQRRSSLVLRRLWREERILEPATRTFQLQFHVSWSRSRGCIVQWSKRFPVAFKVQKSTSKIYMGHWSTENEHSKIEAATNWRLANVHDATWRIIEPSKFTAFNSWNADRWQSKRHRDEDETGRRYRSVQHQRFVQENTKGNSKASRSRCAVTQ